MLGVNGKGLAHFPPVNGSKEMPKLTLKMAALIQGFPKDWEFVGKKTPAYRQVGNAFPPPVARAIGLSINKAIKDYDGESKKGKGSRAKLREYFQRNVGVILNSDELFEASGGKHEFGRRIRDLRNLEGMTILTHKDRSDLKVGQYIFLNIKSLPIHDKTISKGTRAKVLDRDGHTCQSCGVSAGEIHPFNGRKVTLQIGHIIDKSMAAGVMT